MNKTIIITIAVVAVVALLLGVGGVFGYKMYSQLAVYKTYGTPGDLKAAEQEKNTLKQTLEKNTREMNAFKKQFAIYRKERVMEAEMRVERRKETATASFAPLSGYYVIAATATHEQQETCNDLTALLAFEKTHFEVSDAEALSAQEKVCGTYIDKKLEPLFKYQMLRIRASISGTASHLRPDAEEKFEDAKALLKRWEIPVDRSLDKYLRF